MDPAKDRIVVEGRVVAEPERRIYLLLNKPPRTLSTLKDEPGADRRTVADLVDHPAALSVVLNVRYSSNMTKTKTACSTTTNGNKPASF